MNKYIYTFIFSLILLSPFTSYGQVVPCQTGELFNTTSGKPCPIEIKVIQNDNAYLLSVIESLKDTIKDLRDEIKELNKDKDERDDKVSEAKDIAEEIAELKIKLSQFDGSGKCYYIKTNTNKCSSKNNIPKERWIKERNEVIQKIKSLTIKYDSLRGNVEPLPL